jgi:hypothetical protein
MGDKAASIKGSTDVVNADTQSRVAQAGNNMAQDPKEAAAMFKGSRLSGDEQRQAELVQAGLKLPAGADDATKLKQRELDQNQEKLSNDLMLGMRDIDARLSVAKIQLSPELQRNAILNKQVDNKANYEKALIDGKYVQANSILYKSNEDLYKALVGMKTKMLTGANALKTDDPGVQALNKLIDGAKGAMDSAGALRDQLLIQNALSQ